MSADTVAGKPAGGSVSAWAGFTPAEKVPNRTAIATATPKKERIMAKEGAPNLGSTEPPRPRKGGRWKMGRRHPYRRYQWYSEGLANRRTRASSAQSKAQKFSC